MGSFAQKLGLWSSLLIVLSMLVWIAAFSLIAATQGLFVWQGHVQYLVHLNSSPQFLPDLARLFMLLTGFFYLGYSVAVYHDSDAKKMAANHMGLLLALGFCITGSIPYFLQLSSVHFHAIAGDLSPVQAWIQADPNSIATALSVLAWTVFLGSSMLFFGVGRKEGSSAYAWFLGAISGLLGVTGYLLKIDIITFLSINLGLGGALLWIGILGIRHFRHAAR